MLNVQLKQNTAKTNSELPTAKAREPNQAKAS